MGKIVKLRESDLRKIVKGLVKEQQGWDDPRQLSDFDDIQVDGPNEFGEYEDYDTRDGFYDEECAICGKICKPNELSDSGECSNCNHVDVSW
jgi:hypothetical protein